MGMNISIAFIDRTFLLRALYKQYCSSRAETAQRWVINCNLRTYKYNCWISLSDGITQLNEVG